MESIDPKVWLLVEDDENDFILLKRALLRAEPRAALQWVKDGTEAKEYMLGQNCFSDRTIAPFPSVIISDLKMPRCSGLELVQWIRQQSKFKTVPFIMFSASNQASDVGSAYQDGANWYLSKPSTFDDLVEMLRRLSASLAFSAWKALE